MSGAKLTYSEQLRHPNWQRKRLHMLEAAGWLCTKCMSSEKTLHVHHKRYIKGRRVWEYDDADLVVLCELCHQGEHELGDALKFVIARLPAREALSLLLGYAVASGWLAAGDAPQCDEPGLFAEAGRVAYLMSLLNAEGAASVVAQAEQAAAESLGFAPPEGH